MNGKEILERIELLTECNEDIISDLDELDKLLHDENDDDDEDDKLQNQYDYLCDELDDNKREIRCLKYDYEHRNDLDVIFNNIWFVKKYKKIKEQRWLKKHRSTMFDNCKPLDLSDLKLKKFDTSKTANLPKMFENCKCIPLDLTEFDTK